PGGFGTNRVFAEPISIEVRIPAGTPVDELAKAALRIGALVHIEHPSFAPSPRAGAAVRPKSDACFVDRSCVTAAEFPNVALATKSIGQLTFTDQGGAFICTGGLMNTTAGSSIPYLLPANPSFDNQPSPTSLQPFCQY